MVRREFIEFPFRDHAEASWAIIALVLLMQLGLALLLNFMLFPSGRLTGLAEATGGLIQPTLIVNLIEIGIILFGGMLLLGGLSASDVGLRRQHIVPAILATMLLWLIAQALGLFVSLFREGSVQIQPLWAERGTLRMVGLLIAQLLGNGLEEEIVFRGFLLPQIYMKLRPRAGIGGMRRRIEWAVIISQVLFAVMHVPNRLYHDVPVGSMPLDLFTLLGVGALYALLYLRTGNLFVVVGVHSLMNMPTALFLSEPRARWLMQILGLVLLFAWPLVAQGLRVGSPKRTAAEPDASSA